MNTLCFKVSIRCGNEITPITKRSKIQPQIIDWYIEQYKIHSIKTESISFNYIEGYFMVKYVRVDDIEQIADPDKSGNSPINTYGTDCLVIGNIIKFCILI